MHFWSLNFCRFSFVAILSVAPATKILASEDEQTPFLPPNLVIEMRADEWPTETTSGKTLDAASACEMFSRNFVANSGLAATGPFISARCDATGIVSKKSKKSKPQTSDQWTLKIRREDEGVRFEIYWPHNATQAAASFSLESDVNPVILLGSSEVGPLIASHLSTQLPFRSILSREQISKAVPLIGKLGPLSQITFPKHLFVFSLESVRGFYSPTIITRLKGPKLANGQISWTPASPKIPKKMPYSHYFVQHIGPRDNLLAAIKKKIKYAEAVLERKYLTIGRTALIGARYGIGVGTKSGVLSRTNMIGLLAEMRSGPFEGLRLNYDAIPIKTFSDTIGTEEFSWSRLQLGYSFGLKLSNDFINWVDVTPRIGITTLTYSFEPVDSTLLSPYSFSQHRAPTAGIEFGMEQRSAILLLRLWAFGTYSIGVLPIDRQYKTRALRAGLDAYAQLLRWDNLSLAVLGFAAIDSTTISKSEGEESTDASANNVSLLTLNTNFIGFGFSLGW